MLTCENCKWWDTEYGLCRYYPPTVTESGTYWAEVSANQMACSQCKEKVLNDLRPDTEVVYEFIQYRKRSLKQLEEEYKAEWGNTRLSQALDALLKDKKIVKNRVGVVDYLTVPDDRIGTKSNRKEAIAKKEEPQDKSWYDIVTENLQSGEWVNYWTMRIATNMKGSQEEITKFDQILEDLLQRKKIKKGKSGFDTLYKLVTE